MSVKLVIGDMVKNGFGERVEELHHSECKDLKRIVNDSYFQRSHGSVEEFESVEEARAWYDEDEDGLGWLFDDEVKVLPCVNK